MVTSTPPGIGIGPDLCEGDLPLVNVSGESALAWFGQPCPEQVGRSDDLVGNGTSSHSVRSEACLEGSRNVARSMLESTAGEHNPYSIRETENADCGCVLRHSYWSDGHGGEKSAMPPTSPARR